MEIIAAYGSVLLLLTCLFGVFMAWGVGANDVANAMGTSVGSRALTIKQAILIAVIFEFMGAYLAGGEVTSTIRKGIIDPAVLEQSPELLVYGMMAALLAAGSWLLVASAKGWPVSTTHSIVGAIVGFAAVGISPRVVDWGEVGAIAASWVVSPLLAGTISCCLYLSVRALILESADPLARAKRYIPFYMWAVGFMIAMVTLLKGLKHVGLELNFGLGSELADALLFSAGIGLLVAMGGRRLLRRVGARGSGRVQGFADGQPADVSAADGVPAHGHVPAAGRVRMFSRIRNGGFFRPAHAFDPVEGVFAILMIFTACAMAFAHGSNDVANAVGPLAAVASVIASGGIISATAAVPAWVLLLGGGGIVLGLATYGYKVIATVGRKITELTPSRGFAAELGAASTVVLASAAGLPVSTTHTLVGAVLGVGLARGGIPALNLRMVGTIVASWLITLPAGAGLAIVYFHGFKYCFG